MVWLKHCVRFGVGRICGTRHPIVSAFATLDGFQGLQAQVILASLVSTTSWIMNDIWSANTLTSSAESELHLFGPFAAWAEHLSQGAWIPALNAVHWEADSATLELAGALREAFECS